MQRVLESNGLGTLSELSAHHPAQSYKPAYSLRLCTKVSPAKVQTYRQVDDNKGHLLIHRH